MELEELKTLWSEYDKKLEKSLQLNMQLLRKINLDKARFKVKTLLVYKLIEMCIFMYIISWLSEYAVKYVATPRFGIPAIIIDLFVILGFIYDIRQLSIIIQLQMDNYDNSITPLQKKIETLKVMIVKQVKYSYLIIPFYPLMMILGGKVYYNIDFFNSSHLNYLLTNIAVAIVLIPFVLLLYRQLSKKNIKPSVIKNLLQGTGWYQVNSAEDFLNEIEKFEQEA